MSDWLDRIERNTKEPKTTEQLEKLNDAIQGVLTNLQDMPHFSGSGAFIEEFLREPMDKLRAAKRLVSYRLKEKE